MGPRLAALICAFTVGSLTINAGPADAQSSQGVWVLSGVTVIDVENGSAAPGVDIVVRGDRIDCVGPTGTCAITSGAERLDREGYFAIPGLWNSHAHLTVPTSYLYLAVGMTAVQVDSLYETVLRIYLASGVTGLVLLLDDPDAVSALSRAEQAGQIISPRLLSCGWGISYPGSWNAVGGAATPTTKEAAEAAVRVQAQSAVDCIKITIESGPGPVYTNPRMPLEIARAVVEEAHRLDLPVYAHTTHVAETLDALEAGVDVLAHSVTDADPVPDELIDAFARAQPYYSPTLVLSESQFLYIDEPERLNAPFLRRHLTAQMHAALTDPARRARFVGELEALTEGAGVDWLRGKFPGTMATSRSINAAGAIPLLGTDPVWYVVPGYDVHRELELLVESGLTPIVALQAATLNAARAIQREDDFGSIAPGKYADFAVLAANPLEDIRNTRSIEFVVKGGQIYVAGMLLASVGAGR